LSYRGIHPSNSTIGTPPEALASAIIVAEGLVTTDFANFVKIYLLRPIEKNQGPCWTRIAWSIKLAGLGVLPGLCQVGRSEREDPARAFGCGASRIL